MWGEWHHRAAGFSLDIASRGIPTEERTSRKDPTVSWHSLPRIKIQKKQLHATELWQLARLCRCHTASFGADWFPWFLSFDYSSDFLTIEWVQCSLIIPGNYQMIQRDEIQFILIHRSEKTKIHKNIKNQNTQSELIIISDHLKIFKWSEKLWGSFTVPVLVEKELELQQYYFGYQLIE